ncbi:MAG: helix-turn-helix domain-containing protein [Oscillospiraceae bacterium]|nr:helix-turn-helix domain-containing protein [Oscillospiraceae bacterium]
MLLQHDDVLTVKDLSEILKIGRNGAYELVKSGAVQSVKVKTQIRIPKESVICYLRGEAQPSLP